MGTDGAAVVSPPRILKWLIKGNQDTIHTHHHHHRTAANGVHGESTLHTYVGWLPTLRLCSLEITSSLHSAGPTVQTVHGW